MLEAAEALLAFRRGDESEQATLGALLVAEFISDIRLMRCTFVKAD